MGIFRFESRSLAGRGRRNLRTTLIGILLSVASFYVWFCAPLGTGSANASLVALLAAGGAILLLRAISAVVRLRGWPGRRQAPRPAAMP